jgi:hypothetical protein
MRKHFRCASERENYKRDDIKAGREYIRAYVPFIHLVERIYESAKITAHGHYSDTEAHSLEHIEH